MSTTLTVDVTASEANAIVYSIRLALSAEAERVTNMSTRTSPGDLGRFRDRVQRISLLAAINDQLQWRAHWGRTGGEPPPITATAAALLDVTSELHSSAEEQRFHGPDEVEGEFAFDEAARAIARSFAEAEAVPA